MSELEFWKDLGNIFDAVLNYQKKNVEFNNRFINPWIRLGNVFERQDQTNDAVHAYQRATEIDPDTAQNWVDLGDAQFKNGGYDEAIEAYGKAVTLDPEAGWPLGNLALSMVTTGKIEEAIPLYQKSIELLTEAKDKAICWNRLGNAYRKLNDYQNAFMAFQKADELDGENTGFSDKLDETPPSTAIVAPEEILEQMIEEQTPEEPESTALETVTEAVQETIQLKAEQECIEPAEVEHADELVALAPNTEMQIEESVMAEAALLLDEIEVEAPVNELDVKEDDESPLVRHERNFNILQVVKDVITKVELAYAQQESPAIEEMQAAEIAAKTKEEAVTEIETPAATEVTVQEVEAIGEAALEAETPVAMEDANLEVQAAVETDEKNSLEVAAPVAMEDVNLEVQAAVETDEKNSLEVAAPVVSEEAAQEVNAVAEANAEDVPAVESPRVPAWLVIKETVTAEEKSTVAETEMQEELAQAESVTTLSEISQVAMASDLIVNMDVVETYTESLTVQLEAESSLGEESAPETADQLEGQNEAEMEVTELAASDESNAVEESMIAEESSTFVAEEQASELAYEEYLKDMVEPANMLTDHMNEVQGETPITKVSKNGEVRIAMDTKNAHVWNELGNIYLNASAYDDAVASYSKAIELDRHFAWPYSNLALAYVQKGRFAEAILLYQRGIELFTSDKDKAITWNRLGNVYRRVNDYDNAIAAYQTADELDPENATLSLRLSFGLLGNMSPDTKPAYVA